MSPSASTASAVKSAGVSKSVLIESSVATGALLAGATAQFGLVTLFVSSVIEPLRSKTRPWTVVPVWAVIDVSAMIAPTMVLLVTTVGPVLVTD